MKLILITLWVLPFACVAQYKGVSYSLNNETGTYTLTSLTVSHRVDNGEGVTYVTDRSGTDTLYQIAQFLHGLVGLSNDGRTVAHLQTEHNSLPLEHSVLTFYRNGKKFDSALLNTSLKYELQEARKQQKLPADGWLRNDSLYHKMAENAFYVTDDKVFIATDGPLLHVLDMNEMLHIYTGNGANHFMQNYYSIPNLPLRTEFTSSEYFPKEIPNTVKGEKVASIIAGSTSFSSVIPEEASYRLELEILIRRDGSSEIRRTNIFSEGTNLLNEELSTQLMGQLPSLKFNTGTIPPGHPAWLFTENFWLK